MGSWSLTGTLLIIGLFLALCGFLFSQINVTNPYSGQESNIFGVLLSWIVH